jgi:sugar phosphate isomerase/epimerase
MVSFSSGANYYMPMDREYGPSANRNATNDVGVGIGDVGTSLALGPIPNIPSLSAKLRSGVKVGEIGFMGAGKGSGQGHTPEMYGEIQRQALREMQKANEVQFTTHATVGVYGLAGMDQQGNFSKHSKNMAVDEIKRAIDFAADVARGGPVVLHTGEYQRPISEADWNKDKRFRMFEGEEERASFRVVDTRTGAVIQEARKNRAVSRPVWNTVEKGKEYTDYDGQVKKASGEKDDNGRIIYIDYWGRRLTDDKRVPHFNKEKGEFDIKQMSWQELEAEAHQMTLRAREEWEKWKSGKLTKEQLDKSRWGRFLKPEINKDEIKVMPEEAYIISTLETNAANSRGWAAYYMGEFQERIDTMKKLEKAKELYKKIEEATSEEEKWKLKKEMRSAAGDLIPPESKYPTQIIDEQMDNIKRFMKQGQEGASSQLAQAEEAEETIKHVESAEVYAKKEAYEAYAQSAIQAMRRTEELERKGLAKKPIVIAMENLFPESYGAHPEELKDLVLNSRAAMAQMLIRNNKISEDKAKELAERHIGATFDTGHFNMWRKYWRGDPNKTLEDNDKDFDKWFLDKVTDLAKSGVVKHLHIVDNYGYQDEHLAPGQGNTKIAEAIKIFKENGFKGELIVEPGSDFYTDVGGHKALTKAWGYFGNTVHSMGGGETRRPWGKVEYGYFGETQPPYFTFAPYSPSEDWTLWSGTPLE